MRTIEVISGKDRRRRFTDSDKATILAEVESRKMSMKAIGAKYGISNSLLYTWRRQLRQGGSIVSSHQVPPGFVGVNLPMPPTVTAIGHGQLRLHISDNLFLEIPPSYREDSLVRLIMALRGAL
jgi:transposase